jgi:hypothetical protein
LKRNYIWGYAKKKRLNTIDLQFGTSSMLNFSNISETVYVICDM